MKLFKLGSQTLLTITLLCSMANGAIAQNLVRNGGFEDYTVGNGTWDFFYPGSENQFAWTPTEGSVIEIRNNAVGSAFEGAKFAELDSHYYNPNANELGFFQDIATEIGKKYEFSFSFGPRENNSANGDNLLAASFGDFYQEFDAGNNGDGWQSFTTKITATSTSTRLKFVDLGQRNTLGANIDNVNVKKVPEPFSMLGAVIVGALGIQAKRIQQGRKQS